MKKIALTFIMSLLFTSVNAFTLLNEMHSPNIKNIEQANQTEQTSVKDHSEFYGEWMGTCSAGGRPTQNVGPIIIRDYAVTIYDSYESKYFPFKTVNNNTQSKGKSTSVELRKCVLGRE